MLDQPSAVSRRIRGEPPQALSGHAVLRILAGVNSLVSPIASNYCRRRVHEPGFMSFSLLSEIQTPTIFAARYMCSRKCRRKVAAERLRRRSPELSVDVAARALKAAMSTQVPTIEIADDT